MLSHSGSAIIKSCITWREIKYSMKRFQKIRKYLFEIQVPQNTVCDYGAVLTLYSNNRDRSVMKNPASKKIALQSYN